MCIIIAKPQGVALPPAQTIYNCALHNPHGFGFATVAGVYKTMDFRTFYKRLQEVADVDTAMILHFRIATHGSLKRANCHPFWDKETGVAFAHNGILNIEPYKDMTDSETAFRGLYVPIIREYGLDSDELRYEVHETIGFSRFAFLGPDSEIRLFGHFYKWRGCAFSNQSFL